MKTQLKIRTEFSFRSTYGPISKVADRLKVLGCQIAAITDRNSTFGHVQWNYECKKRNIKPLFGVELSFTPDINIKERRQHIIWATLIAKSNVGLREIYNAVEESTKNFYYLPRLNISQIQSFSQDVAVLVNGLYREQIKNGELFELHPYTNATPGARSVPVSDNYMIELTDRPIYEVIMGRSAFNRPAPMHILDEWDLRSEINIDDEALSLADRIGEECNVELPVAENVKFKTNTTLMELCLLGAQKRGLELNDQYMARLRREIDLIMEKDFADYFFVLSDLINWSKQHMLVGPARGSSCGSLVCYLLGITDIDPLPYGLIFERFIDVTRKDLPDIDVDFQDNRRDLAFQYLAEKYGRENVARLGTISRYKAKSAIGESAKVLNIPPWETTDLKNSIIERSSGDSRAAFCILDTFNDTEIGQFFLKKYPAMAISAKMEAHARHHGMHAAGVVITEKPLMNYVARDTRTNTIQIDKYDAEKINLLKIDALGLSTLTVIDDCLTSIGMQREDLLHIPMDYGPAFEILRNQLWCGIFQFEGYTLQSIARRFHIDSFTDIAALTALARPGPFASGATAEWVLRRSGKKQIEYLHPLTKEITEETYGLIIYQEQVMRIVREIGNLSWEDTSTLRKAMSHSLGIEYFDQFWMKFREGALELGLEETLARKIWDSVNTMGSWAFNKSHSVAYGHLSYWCCYLKSKWPLEFALATLKHAKSSDSVIRYLRELDRIDQKFKAFDKEMSEIDWSIKNNILYGGLINVRGIGLKTAEWIYYLKENEIPLPPNLQNKLDFATTPYDNIFETRTKFPKLLAAPQEHGIVSKMTELIDIGEDQALRVVFIAKIVILNLRSLNETMFLVKRNGMRVPNHTWLNMILEDDTAQIPATISRWDYNRLGKKIVDNHRIGDWFIWKGSIKAGQRRLFVERYKMLMPEK